MTIPAVEWTKAHRRELRKKLREELIKVHCLSSKLEARELQLKRQSQSTGIYSSASDVQLSGSDVKRPGGKEVTSQLALVSPGLSQLDVELLKDQSLTENDGTPTGANVLHSKRTPKANQLYLNSEFLVGKDKIPPPVKSTAKSATANKRGVSRVEGGSRKQKPVSVLSKERMELMMQCRGILQKLMQHKDGWVFNEPVDSEKLGLSDYHLIIKKPMDLGSIKAKLDRKEYSSPLEFADNVRLTFKNAMTYNPEGNDVHQMADELQHLFEDNWKFVYTKLEKVDEEGDRNSLNQTTSKLPETPCAVLETKNTFHEPQPKANKKKTLNKTFVATKAKAPVELKGPAKFKASAKPVAMIKPEVNSKPKRDMNYQEKARLSRNLKLLPPQILEDIIRLMMERNPNMSQEGNEIEVDIDSFDNDTLWELDHHVKSYQSGVTNKQKAAEQKFKPILNSISQNPSKRQKGELCEEDSDIRDDILDANIPAFEVQKDVGYGIESSGSGSSSSESGSSSDSDSGSSLASESDADDILFTDKRG